MLSSSTRPSYGIVHDLDWTGRRRRAAVAGVTLRTMDPEDTRQSLDPDDWFAEDEGHPTEARGTRGPGARPLPVRPHERGPLRGRALPPVDRRVLGATLAAVAVVAAVVAAVFLSGGKSHQTQPPPTVPTTTATTPTTTAASPKPLRVNAQLKPGDTGTQVKRLQRALAQLGYYSTKVDGAYGPATVAAVKAFQQAAKLSPDGVVGPKTLRALNAAVAAKTH